MRMFGVNGCVYLCILVCVYVWMFGWMCIFVCLRVCDFVCVYVSTGVLYRCLWIDGWVGLCVVRREGVSVPVYVRVRGVVCMGGWVCVCVLKRVRVYVLSFVYVCMCGGVSLSISLRACRCVYECFYGLSCVCVPVFARVSNCVCVCVCVLLGGLSGCMSFCVVFRSLCVWVGVWMLCVCVFMCGVYG